MTEVLIKKSDAPLPIRCLTPAGWADYLPAAPEFVAWLAQRHEFEAKRGQVLLIPKAEGAPAHVLFGVGEGGDATVFRQLPAKLPADDYRIECDGLAGERIALNWALGAYRFDRYKKRDKAGWPRLVVEADVDLSETNAIAHAVALARDMINTPANDLGPLQIETIAREIAQHFGAKIAVVRGDDLIEQNYPAVHAVGAGAAPGREPRMIEISWGAKGPKVAIIGKGVVFDTGGLDIKPSAGMRLMKKDMGGAAHALALARMVMAARLKVRLSVLIPVAENAISGSAMRPGDVIASRKGLTIEVGNTDAEGRLILADALTRAVELEPDLTLDLATLTGAARIALGPHVIPFFTGDEALAQELSEAAVAESDPLWRLPLWAGYEEALDSEVADIANDPANWAQAGSVTAALFLKRFAPERGWAHFDIYAWNPKARPGHPAGGEAQAIRALYAVLKSRYG